MRVAAWALFLCLLGSGPAWAAPITMNFSAYGFGPSNGNPAPHDPVSGTIVWEAASATAPIDSLLSVDLTINGHVYQLNEIEFTHVVGGIHLIGGGPFPDSVGNLTNDFWLSFDTSTGTPRDFSYASNQLSGVWFTQSFSEFSITAAAVPEPATLVLVLVAGAGLAARRRA